MGAAQAPGFQRENMLPAFPPPTDEPGAFKHLDMLRSASEAHRQRLGEIADRRLAFAEASQKRPAGRVSKRCKDAVEIVLFNHMVEYGGDIDIGQPIS